ncbi:hypothetical protein ABZ319_10705 [Nocardia sp. NPDC005978]|uniref:hypothetical protein n=1 Tax=Nocardia sp. NPDC005978 TaxID=3156725 RepID=UPI0033A4BDC8
MRHGYPDREELEENFEQVLTGVLAGRGVPSSTGLDDDTKNALRAIFRAHPDVTEELVAHARRAFASQLDGSNAERRRAKLDRRLAEGEERSKNSRRTPPGWDPDVFARIRVESEAENAALTPEDRVELDMLSRDQPDDGDEVGSNSFRDRMRDVPGFDENMNPFPLTRDIER